MIQAFRDFLHSPYEIPEKIRYVLHILHTVAISSSECERFLPTERNPDNLSMRNHLFIRIIGAPLTIFNYEKYVSTWLLKGRHAATNTRRNKHDMEKKNAKEMSILCNILIFILMVC